MSGLDGTCLHCRCDFSLASTHYAYGGALFCSKGCLTEWTYENKTGDSELDEVAQEHEVRNPDSTISTDGGNTGAPEARSSSEVSTESRRAGYRLEAEFECFDIDEHLWLDATPIADGDEVKFRSETCPECGAFHWTGCAL